MIYIVYRTDLYYYGYYIYITTRSAHFTVPDDGTADRRARETLNIIGRGAARPAGRNPIAPGQHVAACIRRR